MAFTSTFTGAQMDRTFAGWIQHDLWDFSVDGAVADVVFTDLGVYSEVIILAAAVQRSVNSFLRCTLSRDNGSTFLTTSGDYREWDVDGGQADRGGAGDFWGGTQNTASRSGKLHIWNMPIVLIKDERPTNRYVVSPGAINACRIFPDAGGNINGDASSHIYCFGKV
jgi:hypothetical protein